MIMGCLENSREAGRLGRSAGSMAHNLKGNGRRGKKMDALPGTDHRLLVWPAYEDYLQIPTYLRRGISLPAENEYE
jgi:hypothetical protein